MFINFNRNNKEFRISIDGTEWLNKSNLKEEFNKYSFKEESFTITKDLSIYDKENSDLENKKDFEFILQYRFTKDNNNQLEQFYGASDRYIRPFTKGVRLEKLPDGYSGIFCLTSEYFNEKVTDSRNQFDISENNPSKKAPIVFIEIKNELRKVLNKILLEKFPETKNELKNKKEDIVKSFPHLARYVDKIDNLTISKNDMQKEAEKAFIEETKDVRRKLSSFTKALKKDKKNFNENTYLNITQQFTLVGREQLADYIGYRQTIIEMLLEIYDETQTDKSRFDESDIHNLFMPLQTDSHESFRYANNIWIFDDKFMSYTYAASEITIKQIVQEVEKTDGSEVDKDAKGKKPDLVMFYSNSSRR